VQSKNLWSSEILDARCFIDSISSYGKPGELTSVEKVLVAFGNFSPDNVLGHENVLEAVIAQRNSIYYYNNNNHVVSELQLFTLSICPQKSIIFSSPSSFPLYPVQTAGPGMV
jgi:hypothetical protein